MQSRTETSEGQPKKLDYAKDRRHHWDEVVLKSLKTKSLGSYYHKRLNAIYQYIIPDGQKVLEIGCGDGNLLAALKPCLGVGIDFSEEMIKLAKQRHHHLHFLKADAHNIGLKAKFDFLILSDLINDLWDVQTVFDEIKSLCHSRTTVVINSYSRVWEIPLRLAQKWEKATPAKTQNWFTIDDISSLLELADFEVLKSWREILCPLPASFLNKILDCFIAKMWPFHYMALTNIIVARPTINLTDDKTLPKVSVIIPARNEAGHIPSIFERMPDMGGDTELIFIEGGSSDDTYTAIEGGIAENPAKSCQLFKQTGVGKGDAVRLGFAKAQGDILMILDADLTVAPEDLPRFYDALVSGKGEFINGVRLVYPMEKKAMRFINLLGNKMFGLTFSWILGQTVKDTLCGTKVLWKDDYEKIIANRGFFGEFDPFGDFDLIFGAAKLNLKIRDLPIRYSERKYGTTNIARWKHGWLLIKMVIFACRKFKFI